MSVINSVAEERKRLGKKGREDARWLRDFDRLYYLAPVFWFLKTTSLHTLFWVEINSELFPEAKIEFEVALNVGKRRTAFIPDETIFMALSSSSLAAVKRDCDIHGGFWPHETLSFVQRFVYLFVLWLEALNNGQFWLVWWSLTSLLYAMNDDSCRFPFPWCKLAFMRILIHMIVSSFSWSQGYSD